jgi:hypothetical protein
MRFLTVVSRPKRCQLCTLREEPHSQSVFTSYILHRREAFPESEKNAKVSGRWRPFYKDSM